MEEKVYIQVGKKALSGVVMIMTGVVLIQSWWISYNGVNAKEIRAIVGQETMHIAQTVDKVQEYSEIQYISLKNYDQRLAIVESTHAAIYKAVREEGEQTRREQPKMKEFGEMINRYLHPDTANTAQLSDSVQVDPIEPKSEIDTNELNRVRRNRNPYRKY